MTDQEIIEHIRRGDSEPVIRLLYKELPKIKALIQKTGLNSVLAEEIFNDSLIVFVEKLEQPEFEFTAKATTYLYGINRFLVKNALKKQNRSVELEWQDTLILSADDINYSEEKEEKLNQLESILASISDKCRKIFQLFYYDRESMDSIAKELGFSSINSAKTQKYKCLQRAHQLAEKTTNSLNESL